MGQFVIRGGVPLYGRVRVSGSKNASLSIIFSTIIMRGVSEIRNLPDIGDVRVALDILRCYGARIRRLGDVTYVDTRRMKEAHVPSELTSMLRASTYLLGATLARFGRADKIAFGGCSFSDRPIDMHIAAMISHGAVEAENEIIGELLTPSDFSLRLPSVGTTVNALIVASGIAGKSIIRGIALEPHILNLVDFLRSAGAEITIDGNTATVIGGELGGGRVTVGADMIEAGTYLVLGALCGGRLTVESTVGDELLPLTGILSSAGVKICKDGGISTFGNPVSPMFVTADPYPGFPTDLQPVIAPLLSRSGGKIRDNVWPLRYGYLEQLGAFGVRHRVVGGTAEIFQSELSSANASAPDLRGGMALVMAALAADGISRIGNAEIVLRGYENLVAKLTHIGAEIDYVV